ncbi:MAG: AMP-dependent synthetase and ligase [Bacteroidetes bacterium]|nr:MAG: AMP-dependent synthetase and ligase [Bacteroidota bacterium]
MLDLISAHGDKILLRDSAGEYTGRDLLEAGGAVSRLLGDRRGQRIALLAPPGLPYVAGMTGIWQSGAACVPLCPAHPAAELEHVIRDSEVSVVLVQENMSALLPHSVSAMVSELPEGRTEPGNAAPEPESDAMILYTSGTTGKPKGAVHTHRSIRAQIDCLLQAWAWTAQDRILHFLPLHHTHGIVNKLFCSLAAGARCDMLPSFDAAETWNRLETGDYTIFMAVPTIYAKLISKWEEADDATKKRWSSACGKLRLVVSGSAALPVPVLEKWKMISGHILLERYGMTEIGMALSNPLRGERRPGFVGLPLPTVRVRVVDEQDRDITAEGCAGELQVAGPAVFRAYWSNPAATEKSFTAGENGVSWFRTGDMVCIEKGYFKIAGRLGTDIIKTGGYKVSAIEIEDVLLKHAAIAECAVIGLPDETWGERVTAVIVTKKDRSVTLDELKNFAKQELAPYKIPTLLKSVETLPRNAMGKTMKGELRKLFNDPI